MNLWISGLPDRGFTLLRTGGQVPGPAEGWLLELGPGQGRLVAPGGTVACQGGLALP